MALDARRLEALSLQELSALLDDEEQLQDMAREMEEVRGCLILPGRGLSSGRPPQPAGSPPLPVPLGVGGLMTPRSPEPPGGLGPAVELPVREDPPGLREALPVPSLLPVRCRPRLSPSRPSRPFVRRSAAGDRCPLGAVRGARARRAENAKFNEFNH